MLSKFIEKMLHEDEEEIKSTGHIILKNEQSKADSIKIDRTSVIVALCFFAVAFFARIYFIFFVSNPDNPGAGWFGDAYHHWQIAYLSKEIGFSQGFLRLWDLKGMEFFWGLLHPLFTYFAFLITGNISIGVERGMTAFFGSISVALIYLLCKRYWNNSVAIGAALLAALNPVGVFNDGTGMVEPIGIPFLLLGIYLWPKKPFWAGFSFAVALMARAEYWVFSIFLVGAMLFHSNKKHSNNKAVLGFGFFVPLLVYMKYLLDYTGNAIYPLYYNYLTNIFGTWQHKKVLETQDITAKYTFLSIFIAVLIACIFVLWKKPRGKYLYLLGLGNWLFLGATFGLGAYIKSYMSYVWYVRFMILPYIFVGIVISVALFYYLPKIKFINIIDKLKINWLLLLGVLAASQVFWYFIMNKYSTTNPTWNQTVKISEKIAQNYHGGGLLMGEGNPEITYALVKIHGLEGKNIVSQMFDPYFYMEGDPYQNWGENREIVLNWIKKNNIETIVTYTISGRYLKLAELENKYFTGPVSIEGSNIVIYQITDDLYKDEI